MGPGLALVALLWPHSAHAQVKLEYKFPEGRTLKYKTAAKTSQVLTLAGMSIETESDQTLNLSQTVGKKRDDSSVPVEQKIESIKVDLSLPGGLNVKYDSSDPGSKIENPALAFLGEVWKLVGEMAYTVVLEKDNKVKAVEGTEKLLEKADQLSPMARTTVRSHLESDTIKSQFEQQMRQPARYPWHQKPGPRVMETPGTETSDIGSGQTAIS